MNIERYSSVHGNSDFSEAIERPPSGLTIDLHGGFLFVVFSLCDR